MIRALELLWLRWRASTLQAEIAHGEGLQRDHYRRTENARGELAVIERRINVARLTGAAPGTLINEALKRRKPA